MKHAPYRVECRGKVAPAVCHLLLTPAGSSKHIFYVCLAKAGMKVRFIGPVVFLKTLPTCPSVF